MSRSGAARAQSERGATMVEFVFSALVLITLLVVVMESGILGWRALTAQYIASSTARYASLFAGNEGNNSANIHDVKEYSRRTAIRLGLRIAPGGNDPFAKQRELCKIWETQPWWPWVKNFCENLPPPPGGDWHDDNVEVCGIEDLEINPASSQFGHCKPGTESLGNPRGYVVVRIELPTRYFFQRMRVPVFGEAAARNEE